MNLLLLDANVIISLHKLSLWEQITNNNKVYVPTTIIHQEVYWYPDANGNRVSIDLTRQIGKTIEESFATPLEISEMECRFNTAYLDIHAGELESLAILQRQKEYIFCTSDRFAVIAMVLLNMENRAVSLEAIIKKSGLSPSKVEEKDLDKRFKQYIAQGQQMKIQGIGLKQ